MFTRILSCAVEIAVAGAVIMLGFDALHHDIPAVPPIGYLTSAAVSMTVIFVGRIILHKPEER